MINNVVLLGRLTAAPELKTTNSGTNVLSFTLAVDRRFKTSDGQKQTDFINCVAWRGTAEFINKFFGKGDAIAITGEIQTRKYEDKDGNPRTAVEVIVNSAAFTGGKAQQAEKTETAPGTDNNGTAPTADDFVLLPDDDDLPF